MVARKVKVTLHGVPFGGTLVFFFSKFGEVADVTLVKSKAGIATGAVEIMLTVNRKNFIIKIIIF